MNLFQFLNPTVKPPKDDLFERFLCKLNAILGDEPEFWYPKKKKKEDPLVVVVIYRDIPSVGFITGVTYGLSLTTHGVWKEDRPELCIVVASKNENWAKALGHLVSRLRGECPFVKGQIIRFGAPIVEEATMDAFFIWSPQYLDAEEMRIDIDQDYHIRLQALYPMRETEISSCEIYGPQNFIKHPDFDMFNVTRPIILMTDN